MGHRATATGVHRIVAMPDRPDTGDEPDYSDAFEVTLVSGTHPHSAEEWSRAVFEGAPRPVRWFLLTGWRVVLGLRLVPEFSPRRVLGWGIASNEPDMIRLESQSSMIAARLTFRVSGATVVLTTGVHFTGPMARPLWTAIGPVHRQALPYLLRRAVASLTPVGEATS
jgi:hypothetical protein